MSSARIFISYRRADSAGWAGRLHADLQDRFGEESVFRDVAIPPGVDFVEHIERILDECDVLIAVIGPRWATSATAGGTHRLDDPADLVKIEVQRALERPDVDVIPVLVEGATMPSVRALPPGLEPLTRRNALELSDSRWDYDLDVLDRRLRSLLEQPTAPTPPPAAPAGRRRRGAGAVASRKGRALLAGAGVVTAAAVAVAVGVSAWRPAEPAEPAEPAAPRETSTPALPRMNLPPLPLGWPRELRLGLHDDRDSLERFQATVGRGLRHATLDGDADELASEIRRGLVVDRARGALEAGSLPSFVWYVLQDCDSCDDVKHALARLSDRRAMRQWFLAYEAFLKAAAKVDGPVVLHVEPNLWGFAQLEAEDPSGTPAAVASTGLPELRGQPDDLTGFSRAVVAQRDRLARNVLLAWNLREWGAGVNLLEDDPSADEVEDLARRGAVFYRALKAPFDLAFFSASGGYDSGSAKSDSGRWRPADADRQVRYLRAFVRRSKLRVVLDFIPLGNRRMRAMNNTRHHYQDDRVEWLLGRDGRAHLTALRNAGVIGLLFGGHQWDGATCACDYARDGITNPAPIGSNTTASYSADDDGGLFRHLAEAYRRGELLPL